MTRTRLEEIKKEMEFMNNPAERARAKDAYAAIRADKSKRPISSPHAPEQKESKEIIQNDSAIAAGASETKQLVDDINDESDSTALMTRIKPTPVNVPTWWVIFFDIPGADNLTKVLQFICLAYADLLPEAAVTYQYPTYSMESGTFFNRYVSQIQYHLEQAANDLLKTEKIDKVLALVETNGKAVLNVPTQYIDRSGALITGRTLLEMALEQTANDLLTEGNPGPALALIKAVGKEALNIPTQGSDRFETRIIKRTLLQMAGMAGHANHREKKAEEKEDHGAIELFKKAAELTDAEVANQLFPVLFSEEAKAINAARKTRIFTALIEFAESILKKKAELPSAWITIEKFRAAQATCQLEINKLREDLLKIVSNQIITAGYILDPQIFVELAQWYKHPNNHERFGDWWSLISDLFWENGFGSLQYVAPARDAQLYQTGIGPVVDDGLLPPHTLKNSDGSSHFDASSKLGLTFSFGYFGLRPLETRAVRTAASCSFIYLPPKLQTLYQAKAKVLQTHATPRQSSSEEEKHTLSNVKRGRW